MERATKAHLTTEPELALDKPVDPIVIPQHCSPTVKNTIGQLQIVAESASDVDILSDGSLEPIEEHREQKVIAQGVARLMKGLKGKKNEHVGKLGKKGVVVDMVCLIETQVKEDKVDIYAWNTDSERRKLRQQFEFLQESLGLTDHVFQLNFEQHENISLRVRDRVDALEKLQFEFLSNFDNVDLLNRVKTTTIDLHEALKDEKSFYRQKLRVLWIQEGDHNTKFFHTMMAAKQNRHNIRHLSSDDGRILKDFDDIVAEALGFCKRLIETSNFDISG
ncbi:hypothetical protein GQ457_16G022650 [Hibiscus cannabinus]